MLRSPIASQLPLLLAALLVSTACGRDTGETGRPSSSGVTLTIVSGSENEGLEPILQSFARQRGFTVEMRYLGSVQISLLLENGAPEGIDAVWPASTLWITLGDRRRVVRHAASISRSPVVFGVKRSVADSLGWVGRQDVRVAEILAAADAGRLRFAMASATQSNSGASAYLAFLHALAGSPEVLSLEHLEDPELLSRARRLLSSVERSSGGSGWLEEMVVERWDRYDAMVNYESMVIEADQAAEERGDEPLWAVYPSDAMTIADSPLGFVDHGDPAREEAFLALQQHLLSEPVQGRLRSLGRRTGLLGLDSGGPVPGVFDARWGIDVERVISPVPLPDEAVIDRALELYQTVLRKPSLTAYVLDFSSSMRGVGEAQVKAAMATLLDSSVAERYLLQASDEDVNIVVPFDEEPRAVWMAEGNAAEDLAGLLRHVESTEVGGGTDIYAATVAALKALQPFASRMREYFPAVILMSDGRSRGEPEQLFAALGGLAYGSDVPIFSIAFGDADDRQLVELSERTSGRVFDGRSDLILAFRHAKGCN